MIGAWLIRHPRAAAGYFTTAGLAPLIAAAVEALR